MVLERANYFYLLIGYEPNYDNTSLLLLEHTNSYYLFASKALRLLGKMPVVAWFPSAFFWFDEVRLIGKKTRIISPPGISFLGCRQ